MKWAAFTVVVILAYLTPGPNFAVVLRASTRGWQAGASASAGARLGLCVHTLLAVAGLSAVLARHPAALTSLRLLGGVYLVYLGCRLALPNFLSTAASPASGEELGLTPRNAALRHQAW